MRQVMAAFVQSICPRRVVALYLRCSYLEQARRFIERECGSEIAREVMLAQAERKYDSLTEVCQDLRELVKLRPELKAIASVSFSCVHKNKSKTNTFCTHISYSQTSMNCYPY